MRYPVLFTQVNSNYLKHSIFDCYDAYRAAFSYYGTKSIIAHPPCRLFSRLRKFSNAPVKEKQCAFFALDKVRQFGGILEHPRSSTLWLNGNFKLDGSVDDYGGFLRSVDLSWFGYPAQKKTMLYFCGLKPGTLPSFPFNLNAYTHVVNTSKKSGKKELSKKDRSITPVQMILYFIEVLEIIEKNKLKNH